MIMPEQSTNTTSEDVSLVIKMSSTHPHSSPFYIWLAVTRVHCCIFFSHASCELPVTSLASEELLKSKKICVIEDTRTCVHPPRGCNAYLLTCSVVFEMKRKHPVAVMDTWPVRADGLLPVEEKKKAFRSYGALSITNCQALSSGEVAEDIYLFIYLFFPTCLSSEAEIGLHQDPLNFQSGFLKCNHRHTGNLDVSCCTEGQERKKKKTVSGNLAAVVMYMNKIEQKRKKKKKMKWKNSAALWKHLTKL